MLTAGAPPGNNGTIKIDQVPLLSQGAGDEGNHPHVTCSLALSFFGFDVGTDQATINFTAQPPSGSFTPVPANGLDTNTLTFTPTSKVGNTLDASHAYTLDVSGLTAQRKQGYHVKVSVEVTYSQGSDDKSKVFWYEPCPTSPPSTTTSTTSTSTTSTSTTSTTVLETGSSGQKGPDQGTGTPPLVEAGHSPLASGQAPAVISGQADQAAAAAIPRGAATDLGFFKPVSWLDCSSPWILMILGGALLMGTGTFGLLFRRMHSATR